MQGFVQQFAPYSSASQLTPDHALLSALLIEWCPIRVTGFRKDADAHPHDISDPLVGVMVNDGEANRSRTNIETKYTGHVQVLPHLIR